MIKIVTNENFMITMTLIVKVTYCNIIMKKLLRHQLFNKEMSIFPSSITRLIYEAQMYKRVTRVEVLSKKNNLRIAVNSDGKKSFSKICGS